MTTEDQYNSWINIAENMLQFGLTQNHLNSLWNYLEGNTSALGGYNDPYEWMLSIAESTGGTSSDFDVSNPFGGEETSVTPDISEPPTLLDNLLSPKKRAKRAKQIFQEDNPISSYGQFAGYGSNMLDNLMEEY